MGSKTTSSKGHEEDKPDPQVAASASALPALIDAPVIVPPMQPIPALAKQAGGDPGASAGQPAAGTGTAQVVAAPDAARPPGSNSGSSSLMTFQGAVAGARVARCAPMLGTGWSLSPCSTMCSAECCTAGKWVLLCEPMRYSMYC